MKTTEAMNIIFSTKQSSGFMVHFEYAGDGFLRADYFPDKHAGEELIQTDGAAWELARLFAGKTFGKCVNIYVVDDSFSPVEGYQNRKIVNR